MDAHIITHFLIDFTGCIEPVIRDREPNKRRYG